MRTGPSSSSTFLGTNFTAALTPALLPCNVATARLRAQNLHGRPCYPMGVRKAATGIWQSGILALLVFVVLALTPQPSGIESSVLLMSPASAPQGAGASPGQPGTAAQKLLGGPQGERSKLRTNSIADTSALAGVAPLLRARAGDALGRVVFPGVLLESSRFGRAPPVPSFL